MATSYMGWKASKRSHLNYKIKIIFYDMHLQIIEGETRELLECEVRRGESSGGLRQNIKSATKPGPGGAQRLTEPAL